MKANELAEIIKKELGRQGTNPYRAAKKAGLPDNSIRYILEGKMPSFSRVCEVVEYLNVPLKIGVPTVGDQSNPREAGRNANQWREAKNLNKIPFNSEISAALDLSDNADLDQILGKITKIKKESCFRDEAAALRQTLDQWLKCHNQPNSQEVESMTSLPHSSARSVPTIEYEAAAGGGRINLDEAPQKGLVYFKREWLDKHGIDPTQCAVIRVAGDSMEPTLSEGCSILIDRSRVRLKIGYIYVILTEHGLIVKRLGKKKDIWRLVSDNPAWEQINLPGNADIIGQVIWTARSLV